MKTNENKIKFQKMKLIKFDEITEETALSIGRIDISTRQAYENERYHERVKLSKKINKSIFRIKG